MTLQHLQQFAHPHCKKQNAAFLLFLYHNALLSHSYGHNRVSFQCPLSQVSCLFVATTGGKLYPGFCTLPFS